MYLRRLEERGLIRRGATKPRAIEVVDSPPSRGSVAPLVGEVTAGQPILAQQNIEDYLVMPRDMIGRDDLFALRLEGENMIDAGYV